MENSFIARHTFDIICFTKKVSRCRLCMSTSNKVLLKKSEEISKVEEKINLYRNITKYVVSFLRLFLFQFVFVLNCFLSKPKFRIGL